HFTAEVFSVIGDQQFRNLLAAFKEDGFGAFKEIFSSLAKIVKPDELVNVLLQLSFNADFKEQTRRHPGLRGKDDRQRKLQSQGGPWSKIASLLQNVIRIGVIVLGRIKRLVHRVQTPLRGAQLWVLHHPAAVMILELL